jgi:hypothetical protein
MALSLNPALQTPLQSSLIETPTPVVERSGETAPVNDTPSPEVAGDVASVDDTNQAQQREQASFSPTDESVVFEKEQPADAGADNVSELPPLKVDPPLTDMPTLTNGKNILKGDALQARLQELGTQTTNGIAALSERKAQLSTTLAGLSPESPEYQSLNDTINHVQKAVDQLTELQGQLASKDPKAVAALQELLVNKDNGTAEDKPFEERLTYEKPDGSKATFDNLYGKRTDAGLRDYIARLVEETRTEGPHQQPEAAPADVASGPAVLDAATEAAAEEVAGATAEPETTTAETAELAATTPEESLGAALDLPPAQEEVIVRPEVVTEDPATPAEENTERASTVPGTAAVAPLEGGETANVLEKMTAFLNVESNKQVVSEFTALLSTASGFLSSGQNDKYEGAKTKLDDFIRKNQTAVDQFKALYTGSSPEQREQIDARVIEGVRQFVQDNPDFLTQVSLPTTETETVRLSSLYEMDWNIMGSTLYSGNTTRMA